MHQKNIIVLGVSADIGEFVARQYLADGFRVLGTYRRESGKVRQMKKIKGLTLVRCDISRKSDVARLKRFVQRHRFSWKTFFSSVGTTEPIGRFFRLTFEEWQASVGINSLDQLRVLHALYPYRQREGTAHVVFLAGGGTNNPFRCYSAYCLAKILLIKMCELLDDENPDLKVFIVGPGFTRTKTHAETLKAGVRAEGNLGRVKRWLRDKTYGTPLRDIYDCIRWAEAQPRTVSSGRNFSVVHDSWGSDSLAQILKADTDMYKLRRSGNARQRKRRKK